MTRIYTTVGTPNLEPTLHLKHFFSGDLHPADQRAEDHVVCVENVEDFTTSFLFSLETQHTIG